MYENKLLECYFTRAFYKHILSVPVRAQDLESEVFVILFLIKKKKISRSYAEWFSNS